MTVEDQTEAKADSLSARLGSGAPSGDVGPETDGVTECRNCGHEGSPQGRDHCESCGAFLPANTAGLVVGHRGYRFWQQHDQLYRGLQEEVARDLGHDGLDDAPAAARSAIAGLVQALIIRDSAYRRVVEDGGPLTSKGRTRRAAKVQESYDRRVEAWVRRLGIDREPAPVPSLQEYLDARVAEAGGDDGADTRPVSADQEAGAAGARSEPPAGAHGANPAADDTENDDSDDSPAAKEVAEGKSRPPARTAGAEGES